MNKLALDSKLEFQNNLPSVTLDTLSKYNRSKLVVKDQWASHPSTADRIDRLEKLNLHIEASSRESASGLFKDIKKTQELITDKFFVGIKYEKEVKDNTFDQFRNEYTENLNNNAFPEIFNGYYDNKNPIVFDLDDVSSASKAIRFEELFSGEFIDKMYNIFGLGDDLDALYQIANSKEIDIKSFDYDGNKYKKKEAAYLVKKLTKEYDQLTLEIKRNDQNIFFHFNNIDQGAKLKSKYRELFDLLTRYRERYQIFVDISNDLLFLNEVTPHEIIETNFKQIEHLEAKLITEIKEILQSEIYSVTLDEKSRELLEKYVSKKWKYFTLDTYLEENLRLFQDALDIYSYVLSRSVFLAKKDLLNYKVNLLANK